MRRTSENDEQIRVVVVTMCSQLNRAESCSLPRSVREVRSGPINGERYRRVSMTKNATSPS